MARGAGASRRADERRRGVRRRGATTTVLDADRRRGARDLGARYAAARGARARAAIRDEARRFVVETLVSQVFPAWMGMPSGGGPQATASLPHQPGMYISCSYFLTAALQNAGLVLESRARFAQAPAAWIERALLPPGGQIHRYGNLPPDELEQPAGRARRRSLRRRPRTSTSASSSCATATPGSCIPATRRPGRS